MKFTKRIITALLILAMLFVGAGCGKREEPPVGNDIDVQQEQQMEAQPAHDPADDIQPIWISIWGMWTPSQRTA